VQLVFETIVPEEVIVVKSMYGKRKCSKKTVEPDGDSDEEAQQLINEAENELQDEASQATGMISADCMSSAFCILYSLIGLTSVFCIINFDITND